MESPGYAADRAALLRRLARVEGQVRGLSRMVEADAYCIDVLTQVAATKAAIDRVALLLLEDHVRHCVVDAVRAGDDSRVGELVQAVDRFARS